MGAPNGKSYIFGGNGYDSNNATGRLNDIWVVDINEKSWHFQGGYKIVNQASNFTTGSKFPGGSEILNSWVDNDGNFFFIGNYGYSTVINPGRLSTIWKYDPIFGSWEDMAGVRTTNSVGSGTPGNLIPQSRDGGVVRYTKDGHLYMFGGIGSLNPASPTGNSVTFNDLWRTRIAKTTISVNEDERTTFTIDNIFDPDGIGNVEILSGLINGSVTKMPGTTATFEYLTNLNSTAPDYLVLKVSPKTPGTDAIRIYLHTIFR